MIGADEFCRGGGLDEARVGGHVRDSREVIPGPADTHGSRGSMEIGRTWSDERALRAAPSASLSRGGELHAVTDQQRVAVAGSSFAPGAEPLGGESLTVPGAPLSVASQLAETRLAILNAVDHTMRDLGISRSAACREVGVAAATEFKWRARFEAGGIDALEDNYANCGRRPLATLNAEELQIAGQNYVATKSGTMALRKLANDPRCREEVADAILKKRRSKHSIPKTLRAQLTAKVPTAVIDYHRSPTRVKRESFICPRTLTYLDRMGREQRIQPGDLFERDDMSQNFLFTIDWPWGGDPCSDRYGVRLARGQLLTMIDVGSLFFPSFTLLVRLRDSYRADDIWQWVGQTYRDIGMPAVGERWERGIWQANQLQGTPISAGHTEQERRLGGLRALGVEMIVSQSPTTKIIENRFRYLQRSQATIPGQIGASRGEFEAANRLWTACRNGQRDPRNHFLSHAEVLQQIERSFHDVNSDPVEGALYHGIPAELWLNGGGEQRVRRLTPEQTYLFSRDRKEVTVTKGHAMARFTRPDGSKGAWWFHHPELWRHEGRKVALFMDKEAAQAGATVVHAQGPLAGQVIGHAPLVEGCPQFALGVDMEGGRGSTAMLGALDRQKAFTGAVRAEYRALGVTNTLARGSRASDGAGRSTLVETHARGTEAAAPLPPPEKPAKAARKNRTLDFDDDDALAREVERQEREAEERGEFLVV